MLIYREIFFFIWCNATFQRSPLRTFQQQICKHNCLSLLFFFLLVLRPSLPVEQNATLHVLDFCCHLPTIWTFPTQILCKDTQTDAKAIVGAPTDLNAHVYTHARGMYCT